MNDWKHSITLRLSVAFATLATVVFTALGLYFSRAADAHMAELDAHDLFGKLALIGHVGTQAQSADTFVARLGDALIGEHGVIVTVDGEKGPIFKWPDAHLAAPLAAAGLTLGRTPIRLALGGAEYRVVVADMDTTWVAPRAWWSPAIFAITRIFWINCSTSSGWPFSPLRCSPPWWAP